MKCRHLVTDILLIFLFVSCKGITAPTPPTVSPSASDGSQEIDWLKANAIPFETTDPAKSLQDLDFLKSLVRNARVVALGEATDGTHEFFQMKHRILKYLVENMGFTTFAIWANYPEAERINAYIQTGEGDPVVLLKGLGYWFWNTQEILDMIEWMRIYNVDPAHLKKISFHGFDLAHDSLARQNVIDYIQKVDSLTVPQIKDDFSCYPQLSDTCMKKLQDVINLLNAHRSDYIVKSSRAEFEQTLHSARIIIQVVTYSSKYDHDLYLRYLVENVEWIVDQAGPEEKVVVWAHNALVWKHSEGTYRSMGDYLYQQYKDQLVVFGFLFYHGSFHAMGVGSQNVVEVFRAAEPPGDSYEFRFQAAGLPRFFLDMRQARSDSTNQAWLFTPHPFYAVWGLYNPNNPSYFPAPLAGLFDVVIYFKDTTPSQLLDQ